MRTLLWTLVLVTAGLVPAGAVEIWIDDGGEIGWFDSATPGQVHYVGWTGELPMDGLDFTPDGALWGVADQELFAINQQNGSVTSIGVAELGPGEIYMDISWDPVANRMYGVSLSMAFEPKLWEINLANGQASLVGMINGAAPSFTGGLATSALGVRYIDDGLLDGLYRVEGLNATFLGPEGFDHTFFGGMTIDWSRDGRLYHLGFNQATERCELWTVDNLNTGVGTFAGLLGDGEVLPLSAAIAPVPEPSGLVVVALMAGCVRRRR